MPPPKIATHRRRQRQGGPEAGLGTGLHLVLRHGDTIGLFVAGSIDHYWQSSDAFFSGSSYTKTWRTVWAISIGLEGALF